MFQPVLRIYKISVEDPEKMTELKYFSKVGRI